MSLHPINGSSTAGRTVKLPEGDLVAPPALELCRATRYYRSGAGIGGVSLRVPAGAIYALLGRNGAGKTTTLRILAGQLFASAGELALGASVVPLDRPARRPGLGFVADEPFCDEALTPAQWLELVATLKGSAPSTHTAQRVAAQLRLADVDRQRPIRELSFGTRRKAALWTELCTTTRVLLLDEPLTGLDPEAIHGFHLAAREFTQVGRSIVLSTHLLHEAEAIATHVGILADGRLQTEGTLDHVRRGRGLLQAFLEA